MPSASAHPTRLAALAVSGLLLVGGAAGCSTTQEKAEKHQAEAQRILDRRAQKQKQKKQQGKADKKEGEKSE